MPAAAKPKPRPVGRPSGPRGRESPRVMIRLSETEARALDEWRGQQTRAAYLRARGLRPPG